MAVTVQMPFESVVTEVYQDACVGSSIENGTTMIQFDLRNLDFQRAVGTPSTICWRQEPDHVDMHALSTFHNPITDRFSGAHGSDMNDQHQRVHCTPAIQGVATAQPLSPSVIRLACARAVVCGGSLRHSALLFAGLLLIPMTKSSIKRWSDDIGVHWPTPEERLRHLLALTPAPACHSDGDDPLGTDHGVMVVKDEPPRILITHEAASEHGAEARQLLQTCKALGLDVPAACSDDSHRFPEAIPAVSPQARLPADHVHTVQHIGGHLKKSLLSSRRTSKARGAEKNAEHLIALAKQLWQWRWSLLPKPRDVSVEDTQAMAELESEDEGFVHRVRSMIRPLGHLFDHAHSKAQARLRLHQLRKDIHAMDDPHLAQSPHCCADHWDHALRYRRKKEMGTHRRGSNAESGMRRRRRLETNHDGIRSAATRQHSMQIYQAITSLSLDIAALIAQGPQMPKRPRV